MDPPDDPPSNSHPNSSRWAPNLKTDRRNNQAKQPQQREHSIIKKSQHSLCDEK